MSRSTELLKRPDMRDHLVQFYGDERLLVRNVVEYLAEGARAGEALVVIAVPEHRERFAEGLAAAGVGTRPMLLDAEQTLARFLVDGRVDEAAFQESVGRTIADLCEGGRPLRAYGEMVNVLWKQGRLTAAAELEAAWNRLLATHRFSLYCAYAADALSDEVAGPLESHTHVLPTRRNGELEHALARALDEVLGAASASALRPFIRATRTPGALLPEAEATALWLRRSLEPYAAEVLDRARKYYEEACRS